MESLTRSKSRSKSDASQHGGPDGPGGAADGNPNDTSTLDKEEGNILMSLIAQRELCLLYMLLFWRVAMSVRVVHRALKQYFV
jgi:hypothetical protein